MIFGNVENNSCRHAADLLLTKGRVQLRKKKTWKNTSCIYRQKQTQTNKHDV